MSSSRVDTIRLPEKPCVVKYLEEKDQFLIGSYVQINQEEARLKLATEIDTSSDTCLADRLNSLNERFGSLTIIGRINLEKSNIDEHHDRSSFREIQSLPCSIGGGVFDLCTRHKKQDSSYIIYVAHANGMLGIYRYGDGEIKLLKYSVLAGSKMLTSIDYISVDEITRSANSTRDATNDSKLDGLSSDFGAMLIAGNSEGQIIVLNEDGTIRVTLDVTPYKDPVWQVKFLKIDTARGCARFFVVVTTEDANWLLYEYNYSTNQLVQMYKNNNRDFSAGITCISILRSPSKGKKSNYTNIPDDDNHSFDNQHKVYMLLGSYDETIKFYSLSFSEQEDNEVDGDNSQWRLGVDVTRLAETSIPGGGIWRVNCFRDDMTEHHDNNSIRWDLYVAAMYAGSYLIGLKLSRQDGNESTQEEAAIFEQARKLNFDVGDLRLEKDPLHYGVDLVADKSFYCITDFNNNLCYFAPNNRPYD